jgi:hypothetical protein
MATTTFTLIAVNQTASPVFFSRTGLTVPASSQLEISLYAFRDEILNDESILTAIEDDDILLNDGTRTLTKGESLAFFGVSNQVDETHIVRALSITNIASLSGTGGTVGGVTVAAGDRVALTVQTTGSETGIWVVQSGAWQRAPDFAAGWGVAGNIIEVNEGTYADQLWVVTSNAGSDIVGTSTLTFQQSAGGSGTTLQTAYEAGNTITTSLAEGDITFAGTESFVLTLDSIDANVTGTIDLDATGNIGIGTAADTGTINVATAGTRTVNVGSVNATLNLDASGITVDATGGISIDSGDTTNLSMSANDGANKTLTISATNAGAGEGRIAMTADGLVAIESTAGAVDIQSSGNLTIDSSGGTINIGGDANTGDVNIASAGARAVNIGSATSTGVTIETSSTTGTEITLDSPLTRVTGDLVVEGTTTSVETQTVLVSDNHLYLNSGYTVNSAQTGGLVVNYLPTATADSVGVGGFTAGVAAVSNPTVVTTGSATFSTSDLIQISGANDPSNDGLFEVLSHSGTTLTIRGVGVTGCVEDFTQNQFVTDSTAVGTITKVNISVMRAGTDGAWEVGQGSATPITFTDVATSTTVTLQNAYVGGNTINVTSGEGDLAVTLTSADFTVNGANDIDFGGTSAITSFNVDASAAVTIDAASISLDATSASNFSVTGANLTLATITSGNLALTSAGTWTASGTTMDLDATGALSLNSSGGAINIGNDANAFAINVGTGAAARAITVGNGTGATGVTVVTGTEGFQINSLGTGLITDYGKSAADPTARAGGFQDGDRYFNTSLEMEMRYDASRSKWLSVESVYVYFGRNGATAAASYYRGMDGLVMSATSGFRMPFNGTIVGVGYTRSDTDSATFDVVEGGTSRVTLASTATAGGSNTSNTNVTQNGIIAVLNQTGGNTTSDVAGWVKLRYRA